MIGNQEPKKTGIRSAKFNHVNEALFNDDGLEGGEMAAHCGFLISTIKTVKAKSKAS